MNKTTIYIVVIIVLLAFTMGLFFSDRSSISTPVKTYFDEGIDNRMVAIAYTSKGDSVRLTKSKDNWILNRIYKADDGFVNTLISIISHIQSVRSIQSFDGKPEGNVEITLDDGNVIVFSFGANPTRTKSYFIRNNQVNEVTVPGYRDNVIDIFTLHPDQWRDRLVMDGSWRSIQKLTIEGESRPSLEIRFENTFFLVNGQTPQDSAAVVDYLNQFQYFEANEMISQGRFPAFDSLMKTVPLAILLIDDIKEEKPTELNVFPALKNQAYHLVMKENVMMAIDAGRVRALLAKPEDFLSKN